MTTGDAGRWARFPAVFLRWRVDRSIDDCMLEQLFATHWGDPAELAAAARVLEGWTLQVQGGHRTVIRLEEE